MDHEYLQNVMGSPYVQEGAFSRLKTKGAQAMGAMGAMAGHQIQSPAETKLRSLWDGFIGTLKGTMKDWSGQVSPMFDEQVPLTSEKQRQAKEALDQLSRLLTSVGPEKIDTAQDQGYHDPNVRNQRDNPDTFVKGSAYNRSTTTPSKLTEIVGEGFWDAAKRDMGLNKALGSNDPSTILDSYKNHVLSLFQNFMKDAVKVTKMTAQQIYSVLAKMQPSQQGWQAAGNMQKVVQQLQTLQKVGDITGQGEPPVMHEPAAAGEAPPVIQQPPQAQQPPQQPAPPVIPKDQPAPPVIPPDQSKEQPKGAQQSGNQNVAQGGEGDISPKEYPYIILHAIKIINNAVTSDSAHTGHFFDADPTGNYTHLPTTFGGTSLSKESKLSHILREITAAPKKKGPEGEEGEEPEVPGEFLYNFHSKFHKWPGQPFSIDVKPVGMSNEVPGLPGVKIEVIWNCNKTLNRIYVIAEKNGKKSKPLMIMQFYDHHVSSQAGATGGGTNQFSPEKLVQASNPTAPSKLAGAPPEILEAIKKQSETLMRSLMATTYRKPMEFKSKAGKNVFPLKWDDSGSVTYKDKDGQAHSIDKDAVKEKLEGDFEESKTWADSLDHFGYFEKFKDMKPKDIDEYPEFGKALNRMLKQGTDENTARKLLYDAWVTLRKDHKKAPGAITSDELVALCAEEDPDAAGVPTPAAAPAPAAEPAPTGGIPPAFTDAQMAMEKLGYKKGDSIKALTAAWTDLTASKKAEGKTTKDITADELLQAAVSGKKSAPAAPTAAPAAAPAPAAPPTPVSQPAGAPAPTKEPTAPVSGAAGAPAPTKDPTAPVSTNKPEPDKGQGQTPPPAKEKAPTDSGKIDIKGDNLEWENPVSHEIHNISPDQIVTFAKTKPKFLSALKANPDMYNKYKDMINQKIALKKKGNKPEGGEGEGEKPTVAERCNYINPFNRDNLLLS